MIDKIKKRVLYEKDYLEVIKGDNGCTDKVIELNNGERLPRLGFGTFQLVNPKDEIIIYNAIKYGYKLIDTAAAYSNEAIVGNGIKQAVADGLARRQDVLISTKIWVQDYGDDLTLRAIERALKRLGSDYLDICLLHYPYGDVYGAWRALEKAKASGIVKTIGVSNFPNDRLLDLILHNNVCPSINQVETNPINQQIDTQIFLNKNGIVHEAWSPLCTGKEGILKNRTLMKIAKKYEASVSQVIIKWLIQRGTVPIVKASQESHILQNIDISHFSLDTRDMLLISHLNKGLSVYFGKEGVHSENAVRKTGLASFDT